MPNMVSGEFGQVVIAMHNHLPIEDASWDEYLNRGERIFKSVGGDLSKMRWLTITDGAAPNAAQRNRLRTRVGGGSTTTSVITESMVVRAVIGIFSVFIRGLRVFHPNDWESAFRYIEVPPDRQEELKNLLRTLREKVGGVRSLDPMLDNKSR
jgi:hypothetical protein